MSSNINNISTNNINKTNINNQKGNLSNAVNSNEGSSKFAQSKVAKLQADYKQIILELRAQNFDVIRFATYRTASKLRFIQKKLNLHLIDLWNIIETFRDNNIHTLELGADIEAARLETCIQNMYIELNKRLAFSQHINVDAQTQLLTAWLLSLYDKSRLSRIKVISFKTALTTMCAGKLTDKIKYIFNQISDPTKNCLVPYKFEIYLKELLVLPTSVFEEPSFGYNENLSKSCFDLSSPVRINEFLNVALSDLGPACFIWLNIFHRFTVVQNVQHPITCSVCQRSHFNGFRYKCQKCRKYQLCQDCFWRGRVSGSHQLSHQMKEYTNYKSAAKQFTNTLKKSLFCKPTSKQTRQQLQQQELLQQERQSQLLQAYIPVENYHQLSYQKQLDYENSLSQNKNSDASKSMLIENNSDYNLIYPSEQRQVSMSGLSNVIVNDSVYSTSNTLKRGSIKQNMNDYNESINNESTNSKTQMQNLLISPSNLYDDPPQPNNNYHSSSLNRSQPTNSVNLQMPKALNLQENLTNCPNLLAKFLIANNISPNETYTQDEHNLIANYSSVLSEFYAKNSHLAQSPTACQSTTSLNQSQQTSMPTKLKPAIKPKPILENSSTNQYRSINSQYITDKNRTGSLQRTGCPSASHRLTPKLGITIQNNNGFYNNSYMNGSNTISSKNHVSYKNHNHVINDNVGPITHNTRSLSESNFRTNSELDDYEKPYLEEVLLKEKRDIVAKLEKQNKEIINEINRLRLQQMSNKSLEKTDQLMMSTKDTWALQQQLQAKLKSRETTPVHNISKHGRLKTQTENQLINSFLAHNPQLVSKYTSNNAQIETNAIQELQTLKSRKDMLQSRMMALESSRDELIGRLTQLDSTGNCMKYIASPIMAKKKYPNSYSLRTTPINSPRPGGYRQGTLTPQTISYDNDSYIDLLSTSTFMPIVSASLAMQAPQPQHQRSGIITSVNRQPVQSMTQSMYNQPRSYSTPTTPALNEFHTNPGRHSKAQIPYSVSSLNSMNAGMLSSNASLNSVGSGGYNSDSLTKASNLRTLRNDLLLAADSVTNAMQGLVRELNSETESGGDADESGEEGVSRKQRGNYCEVVHVDGVHQELHNKKYSIDQYSSSQRPCSSYSMPGSLTNTPVMFRKHFQESKTIKMLQKQNENINNDAESQQNKINLTGYRNGINLDNYGIDLLKESDSKYEADDDEEQNCGIMGDSYINEYDLQKYKNIKEQNKQRIQEEFDLQQQEQKEIEFENKLLADNLNNKNDEQLASWRRELEHRLFTDEKPEKTEVNNDINDLESDEDEITNRNANIIDVNNNVKSS